MNIADKGIFDIEIYICWNDEIFIERTGKTQFHSTYTVYSVHISSLLLFNQFIP